MTRTDIHRPSTIVPADYDFVAVRTMKIEHIGDADFIRAERERLNAHMEKTGGKYSGHFHGGSCHICGAHAQYLTVFHHRPSNSYICTGMDCAEKLDWDSGEGEAFRKKVKDALDHAAGKAKAAAVLERDGLSLAWEIFNRGPQPTDRREEVTIRDMVSNLIKYGSFSDRQTAYIGKLVEKVRNRAAIDAQRAAENAAAAPVPTDGTRRVVRGTLLSIKRDDFGCNMLVRATDGWKVFGTMPMSLRDVDAKSGDEVEFQAVVKPSRNDPKFGYLSRPTKARVVAA